jgi:hypothetical protein
VYSFVYMCDVAGGAVSGNVPKAGSDWDASTGELGPIMSLPDLSVSSF